MEKTMLEPEQTPVVSWNSWFAARMQLLEKERELTRLTGRVIDERRKMPRVKMVKPYVFEGPAGKLGLADCFGSRNQLILMHFMFAPDWEEGCRGCSFGADSNAGMLMHLEHHGFAFVAVSRAPLAKIEAFKKRMGWHFNWVSSFDSDFNFDFHVSFTPAELESGKAIYNYQPLPFHAEELPGLSLFEKDAEGQVYHVYSGYGREAELLIPSLCLELRDRDADGPLYDLGEWVRHHDRYEDKKKMEAAATGGGDCCHAKNGGDGI